MKQLIWLALMGAAAACAQMTPLANPNMQFFDNNGIPLAGGLVYTYLAGTTSPATTYSDSAGQVPNANPIILNAAGRATIYLGGYTYKILVDNSAGSAVYTQDNIPGGSASFRKVILLDNSGYNTPGQWSIEFDAAPGQNLWSIKDPAGNFPFYLDHENDLALFQYPLQVGTSAANEPFIVNGSATVTGTAAIAVLNASGAATFTSAAIFNGGLVTSASSNSSIYMGAQGNFWLRVFSGTPSCGGVADGWSGIDNSGDKLWVCIGGVAKYAQLN